MSKYPIVILPGWLLESKRYEALSHAFNTHGYHAIIVDFPGFEGGVKLTQAFNLSDYVKYLQKYLKLRKVERAIFIGHSFGGRVALKFISQEPKRAAAIVISGTPGFPDITKLKYYLTVLLAKTGKVVSFIPPFIFFRTYLRKIFYRFARANDYLQSRGFLRETFKNIIREQLTDYMSKIRIPTLLLWGEKDRLVPVRTAKRMQARIKNSQLIVVPKAGHMFVYREPAVFVSEVDKFLKGLEVP